MRPNRAKLRPKFIVPIPANLNLEPKYIRHLLDKGEGLGLHSIDQVLMHLVRESYLKEMGVGTKRKAGKELGITQTGSTKQKGIHLQLTEDGSDKMKALATLINRFGCIQYSDNKTGNFSLKSIYEVAVTHFYIPPIETFTESRWKLFEQIFIESIKEEESPLLLSPPSSSNNILFDTQLYCMNVRWECDLPKYRLRMFKSLCQMYESQITLSYEGGVLVDEKIKSLVSCFKSLGDPILPRMHAISYFNSLLDWAVPARFSQFRDELKVDKIPKSELKGYDHIVNYYLTPLAESTSDLLNSNGSGYKI